MKSNIDFIMIGAQKSGTTTLFHLMKQHPEVYLPSVKEAPFFNSEDANPESYRQFISTYFNKAKPDQLWGKITPQYMTGTETMTPPRIAERIHQILPATKIIAILRDPVERFVSQYKMTVKRTFESRSLTQCISDHLKAEEIQRNRAFPTEKNSYLIQGEYYRLLKTYYEIFERDNVFVCFTKELEEQPAQLIRRIFEFIGVDASFIPANTGKRYHVGGSRRKWQLISGPVVTWKIWTVHWRLQRLVQKIPDRYLQNISYWLDQWNTKVDEPASAEVRLSDSDRLKLSNYYRDENALLKELLGTDIPWEQSEYSSK